MLKLVHFFKRKDGLTVEEFQRYYEDHHAKLVMSQLNVPGVERYVRRYLKPMKNPVTGELFESGFDVVTEVWFTSQETFERFFATSWTPKLAEELARDEEKFLDRSRMCFFTVDEHDSSFDHLAKTR